MTVLGLNLSIKDQNKATDLLPSDTEVVFSLVL